MHYYYEEKFNLIEGKSDIMKNSFSYGVVWFLITYVIDKVILYVLKKMEFILLRIIHLVLFLILDYGF